LKAASALAAALVALSAYAPAQARLMRAMDCQELFSGPDLIVIARPATMTTATAERTVFPNDICDLQKNNSCAPLPAIGVETKFRALEVLKGDRALERFTLHHYKEPIGQPDSNCNRPVEESGPETIWFNPKFNEPSGNVLLFLTKEADGRYAPYGGQTDPARFSIFKLASVYDPADARKLANCSATGDHPQCRLIAPVSATADCHLPWSLVAP
jgi:hypothetical protein